MKRQIVYESAPYRSKWGYPGRVWNVLQAMRDARKVTKQGYCVFVPHLWAFLDFFGHSNEDFWLKCGLKMIPKCQILRLRKGWQKSQGACAEFDKAVFHGLKIWDEIQGDITEKYAHFNNKNSVKSTARAVENNTGDLIPASAIKNMYDSIKVEEKPYICGAGQETFKTMEQVHEHMKIHDAYILNGTLEITNNTPLITEQGDVIESLSVAVPEG